MNEIKRITGQAGWQLFAKLVSAVSTLITLGVVSRFYSGNDVGILTLVMTYLLLFGIFADFGLNAYILPLFDKEGKEANELFTFRFYWSLVLILAANLAVFLLPFANFAFHIAVLFGSLTIIFSGFFNSANLVFQKNLRYDLSSIASALGSLVLVPVVLFLSYLEAPVQYIILGSVSAWLVNNIFALTLVKKLYKFKLQKIDLSYFPRVMKVAWPISLMLILNSIYFRIDSFILATYKSFAEVGAYNIAYQVFQNLLILPTFVMNAYYPLMISAYHENIDKFIKQIKVAAFLLVGVAILGAALLWLLAPLFVQIIGGLEGTVVSLRILSFSLPAFFLTSLFLWFLITIRRYKLVLLIYVCGLVFNSVANFIFIPIYSYSAAAYMTGVSEYLILIFQVIILIRIIPSLRRK